MSALFPIHVRTVTGLEEILAGELKSLGAQFVEPKSRLVVCKGDIKTIYQANLWCRTAIRVLRPIHSFTAINEKAFYQGIQKVDWSKWLLPLGTLAVDADVRSSFATHSLYISQLTKDAVVDQFRTRFGKRPNVDRETPDIRIVISLFKDSVQVYLDASGDSLHKRGYRRKTVEAPLSETLSAGIVSLTGWDKKSSFLDPMCGSGTLCIEAALMQRNIAPGLFRERFGFQSWPDYDQKLFETLKAEAKAAIQPASGQIVFGFDNDPRAIESAKANVLSAGLQDSVHIELADFFLREVPLSDPGVLVMNPPYDERLPLENAAEFFQSVGDRLKKAYAGWKAFVLSGNLEAVKYLGLKTSKRTVLYNGSIECRLLEYELRASSAEGPGPRWRQADPTENPKWQEKASVFTNRVKKNFKHLSKKAPQGQAWRVYEKDIPEFPYTLDIEKDAMTFTEVQRYQGRSPIEHGQYIRFLSQQAAGICGVNPEKIYLKKARPERELV